MSVDIVCDYEPGEEECPNIENDYTIIFGFGSPCAEILDGSFEELAALKIVLDELMKSDNLRSEFEKFKEKYNNG